MKRREFITLVGGTVAWPFAARAQPVGTLVRVGFLGGASSSGGKALVDCFRTGMQNLGWVEGKNIDIAYRWTEGIAGQYPLVAAELVRLKPDVIVAVSTPGTQAIQRATREIPVVFIAVSDPVSSGIVPSLSRPGGNITGVSNFLPATTGKLLELLQTIAPNISRVGVLYNPSNEGKVIELGELQTAARRLGVAVAPLEVRSSGDFESAFTTAAASRCDALVTLQEGVTLTNRMLIAAFAEKSRLPAIYQIREFVDAGGLISYGLNYCEHYRRGAYFVDKILKGANPAELPVELPTKFELVINLKTAKALGLTVAPALLTTADELIE
jgi:putative ABC transport system substrate-binding protein